MFRIRSDHIIHTWYFQVSVAIILSRWGQPLIFECYFNTRQHDSHSYPVRIILFQWRWFTNNTLLTSQVWVVNMSRMFSLKRTKQRYKSKYNIISFHFCNSFGDWNRVWLQEVAMDPSSLVFFPCLKLCYMVFVHLHVSRTAFLILLLMIEILF